jgi:uncharacterized membrane protein
MQNRTVAMIVTAVTAIFCGCFSIISCVWGVLIAKGTPVNVTGSAGTSQQTFPPAIGFGLLCLSVIMILIPVAVGFFTLRKKPDAVTTTDVPPAA